MLGNGTLSTLTLDDYCAAKGFLPDPATNACSATTQPAQPARNPYGIKVGEALIKFLAPGKYGLVVVPPRNADNGTIMSWSQTATIEGTPTVDAWVKANESNLFVEGFGTGFNHAFFGFVKTAPTEPSPFRGQTIAALGWQATAAGVPVVDRTLATGSVAGTLRLNHFSRPPNLQGYFAGEPIPDGWVGLNDPATGQGLYAAPCDPATGHFLIENVPPGTYQLVNWDTALDYLFGIQTVTVPAGTVETATPSTSYNLLVFRWFGNLEGSIFLDTNRNGIREAGEIGIPDQAVNLRFRDGSIYQSTVSTPPDGEYALSEVFPFFKWLVTEVDFARFKATGATNVVDDGGDPVGVDLGLGSGRRRQADAAAAAARRRRSLRRRPLPDRHRRGADAGDAPLSRADQHDRLGQGPVPGRRERRDLRDRLLRGDPRRERPAPGRRRALGAGHSPGRRRTSTGISNADGVVDDLNGDGLPTLADADNYPFQWAPVHQFLDDGSPNPDWTGVMGAEDVDRNGNGAWDPGDAINTATTDSFDDNRPSGCIQTLPVIRGEQIPECADAFGTWNQIRDGVFDGGYAFNAYYPGGMISGSAPVDGLPTGTYIVEAVTPPHYELLKEEDKNVDFGVSFVPSPQVLPPLCFGAPHTVPPYLSFNTEADGTTPLPGVDAADLVPGFYAGQTRPLCNIKQIAAAEAKNAAVDFYFFTQVPKAARAVGFANNDLGAEFNQASPNYGEKLAPSWIPVSFHDWTGREITRVYTDEFGSYNALIPSTFTVNVPSPTGVSPQMLTLILNNPVQPGGAKDPYYNPVYSITPWTLDYMPAKTSYLDTPLVPLAAFAVNETQDRHRLARTVTPVIGSVKGSEPETGALICTDRPNGRTITITSSRPGPADQPQLRPGSDRQPVPDHPRLQLRRRRRLGPARRHDPDAGQLDARHDRRHGAGYRSIAGVYRLTVTRGDNGRTTAGRRILLHRGLRHRDRAARRGGPDRRQPPDPGRDRHRCRGRPDPGRPRHLQRERGHVQAGPPAGRRDRQDLHQRQPRDERTAGGLARQDRRPGQRGGVDAAGAQPLRRERSPGLRRLRARRSSPIRLNPATTATLNPGFPFATPGQARIDGFTISGSKAGGGIHVACGVGDAGDQQQRDHRQPGELRRRHLGRDQGRR